MPDCEYCGASFDDEDALVAHLGDEHYDELGRIDRRRVDARRGTGEGGDLTVYLALGGGLALFGVVVYFLFLAGGGSSPSGVPATPYGLNSVHQHGTINVTIQGAQVNFAQPQYQISQTQNRAFHFEGGDGEAWHSHAQGVTVEYAMATLDIGVTENTVTFEGVTYNASNPGTSVSVTVNGDPVDPTTYILQGARSADNAGQGDHIKIVVRVEN